MRSQGSRVEHTKVWVAIALLAGLLAAPLAHAASQPDSEPGDSASESSAPNKPAARRDLTLILPYLALGGESEDLHFITGLTIRNSHTVAESISVEVFDNDWRPLPVILNGESEMSGKTIWTIPPQDSRVFVMIHPSEAPIQGWIRMSSPEKSSIEIQTVVRAYEGDSLVLETGANSSFEKLPSSDVHLISLGDGSEPTSLPALPLL